MTRVVVWAALLLAALFLLTTGGTYPGIASVEAHVIGQVIAYLALGGWFLVALIRPEWRPSTPLFLPIMLATGAYLLSFAFSQRPRLSLEPTLAGVGWAFGYLFISRLLVEPWFRVRVRAVVIAFAVLVAVGYIVQVVVEWISWWLLIGFLAVPPLRPSFAGLWFGSPNLIATALILTAPLAVALLWEEPRRRWRAVALGGASLLAIFLSGSRGAWLGVAVAFVVALALAAGRGGPRRVVADASTAFHRRPILLVLIGLVALAALALFPAALRRLSVGGEDLRLDLWRSALTIFIEHPITGGGPGTWVQLKVLANPPGAPNLILPHAHNMYLQAAGELGVVGLGVLTILAVAVAGRLLDTWRRGSPGNRRQAASVVTGLAALAGQSLVDNLVNLPFVCLLLVVFVAWPDASLPEPMATWALSLNARGRARGSQTVSAASRARRSVLLPVLGLLSLGVAAPVLLRIDAAAFEAEAGNRAALTWDWERAAGHYLAASKMDPGFTLYELELATALASSGQHTEAISLLEQAIRMDPVPIHRVSLAHLLASEGHVVEALREAAVALRIDASDPTAAMTVGLVAEAKPDHRTAIDAYALAVVAEPSILLSPYWHSPDRTIQRAEVVGVAIATTQESSLRTEILAYAGDTEAAAALLGGVADVEARSVLAALVTWQAGDPGAALQQLQDVLRQVPQNVVAASLAARISRSIGDEAGWHRFATWATVVKADSARGLLFRADVPTSTPAPGAGIPINYPWSVYLRPSPPYLLIGAPLVDAR